MTWENQNLLTLLFPGRKGTSRVQLSHAAAQTHATFDDPNLVSHAGLVPAMRLAGLVGLEELACHHVRVAAAAGANAGVKVGSLIAGMIAGADEIDGMDLLRHGAIPATFSGIRAPSTLGSFLRAFTHGNVRQLAAVHRRVLAELATRTPAVFDEAGCLWVAANATYVVRVVSFPAARAATSTLSSEVTTRSAPAAASAT